MIDNPVNEGNQTNDKSPLVLVVPPNSPLIGLRDSRTGLLIVIGCQVAVCPECGSVQLEESWSAGGGCFNPDCTLSPELPVPILAQEPTLTFPYHRSADPKPEGFPKPVPEIAPPPTVMPGEPKPVVSVPPRPVSMPVAPPSPQPPPEVIVPPKPQPVPARPIITGAAKPPPYIAPRPKPGPQPVAPQVAAESTVPQPSVVTKPQPKPASIPEPPPTITPVVSPITSTLPPPIMEIPEGWLTPVPTDEAVPPVAKPPAVEEIQPPPPPTFYTAAPPPEGSIIPTPMLLPEGLPEELPSVIAPPIADRLCILCSKPISGTDKVRICARCGAVHHLECWEANRGCGRPLCGSKVTLAQARPETDTEELPPKPFYSDPWGKPHRPLFSESLRTILGKKEILIGLAAVVVVVVIIFILISAFGQAPKQETSGNVTVTMPSGSKAGTEDSSSAETPTDATNIVPGITPKVIDRTGKKQPVTPGTPAVTTPITPTTPSAPVFPALEESDIRQGLAGVQQNASLRYQSMLKKKSDLRGSIIMTFTVNPNGTVSGLMVAKNTMNDATLGRELESQITNGIKKIRFRQSPKGKTTSFTFSFAP
jgi:hypothetical protein